MSYNNINSPKYISSSDNLVNADYKFINTRDLFIENRKLNKSVHNIEDKKFTSKILYNDFCFWVNHHTKLPDCITKIHNLYVKYGYIILCIILFYFLYYFY